MLINVNQALILITAAQKTARIHLLYFLIIFCAQSTVVWLCCLHYTLKVQNADKRWIQKPDSQRQCSKCCL